MPQAPVDAGKVTQLIPSLKPLVLPEIAAKLFLDAQVGRGPDGAMVISFEGEVLVMHEKDFDLAARVSRRLKTRFSSQASRKASFYFELLSIAQKYICEELFKPGSTRVLYFPSTSKGSSFYRCLMPAKAMEGSEKITAHVSLGRAAREAIDYDVVVFQIAHEKSIQVLANALKQMGKKIVYEIDDAFDALEPWHPRYDVYSRPEVQAQVHGMFAMADLVTVTTPYMKSRYSSLAKRIEIIPNFIPASAWPRATPKKDEFRILWAGSSSHAGDFKDAAPALAEFLKKHQDARFFCFGQPPDPAIPQDRVVPLPFCGFEEYPIKLAEIGASIAIAPLAQNEFNRCKSNLKVLEYGACGYPIIASNIEAYNTTIKAGVNGYLVTGPEGWFWALEKLYNDVAHRESLAEAALKIAEEYDVNRHTKELERIFTSV